MAPNNRSFFLLIESCILEREKCIAFMKGDIRKNPVRRFKFWEDPIMTLSVFCLSEVFSLFGILKIEIVVEPISLYD